MARRRSKSINLSFNFDDSDKKGKCSNFIKNNKLSQIIYEKEKPLIKLVPPFSIQSTQKNTEVLTLPCKFTKNVFYKNNNIDDITKNMINRFKKAYLDRQLPLQIVDGVGKKTISWNISLEDTNISTIKNLFQVVASGLPSTESPYETIALEAFDSLLLLPTSEHCLYQVLTDIVLAIRKALDYGNDEKKIKILNIIIKMTKMKHIGICLVPYYKQLLGPLRQPYSKIFLSNERIKRKNDLNYHLSHYIHKTLVALEESGGRNALVNICYVIPHYQSVFQY
ncbi:Parkin co-regulated protein family-containing protein [Strongyloides ratti]|uniref:Parkin co-regulated protein family-containing protein n=1 Tax=Strongyloides ratti TaxID=34506 RepID=A0A090KSS0_STRRB|nr:Parkin co-regulated protein family-containing protein [Strongyloides ratti]CEF60550.1 Parkin co-regulated protein family-containing protein [Strongyloides ratti]